MFETTKKDEIDSTEIIEAFEFYFWHPYRKTHSLFDFCFVFEPSR